MSRFEDEIATRKRAERKKRQQFLQEAIASCKIASFAIGDVYWLFQFFSMADPADGDLMQATRIIEDRVADLEAFWEHFNELIPPKE